MGRVRFLVTGSPRSGTTPLVWLLDSHAQIRCYGGVFNPGSPGSIDPHAASSVRLIDRLYASEQRLDNPVRRYECEPGGPRAVGFKAHFNHWEGSVCKQHVIRATDIRVLHVRRRNILRQLVSRIAAHETGTWNRTRIEGATHVSVAVSREQLEQAERADRHLSEAIARDFTEHERLEVWYEDLDLARGETVAVIQRFLGVDLVSNLHTETVKLGAARLEDAVTNYQELEREVEGTPLHRYFC